MRPTNIFTQAIDSEAVKNPQKPKDLQKEERLNETRDITRSKIEYLHKFFKNKSAEQAFINNQDS
jgi:hypothetical protein